MGGGSYMDGVGRAIRDDGGGAWSRAGAMGSVLAKRCKACYVLCAMEPLPLGLMSIRPPILPLLPPFGMKPAGPSAGVGGAAGAMRPSGGCGGRVWGPLGRDVGHEHGARDMGVEQVVMVRVKGRMS